MIFFAYVSAGAAPILICNAVSSTARLKATTARLKDWHGDSFAEDIRDASDALCRRCRHRADIIDVLTV
jgi:hypothetical protein